jgi:peptide-methionine (S)-S-oxide reductase
MVMISNLVKISVLAGLGVVAGLLVMDDASSAASLTPFPDPVVDSPRQSGDQIAVFAGGCFWCTEAVFEQLAGVKKVISGFAGGTAETAHYETVSAGRTNHAEAIQITYDPSKITYGQLLKVLFSVAHDPTTKDRQGPDWGKQYRSAIFYGNADQKRVAEDYIKQLNEAGVFKKAIVTEVAELKGFYPAEEYHQDFVKNHPGHPYVVVNSLPKLDKLKKMYPDLLKK